MPKVISLKAIHNWLDCYLSLKKAVRSMPKVISLKAIHNYSCKYFCNVWAVRSMPKVISLKAIHNSDSAVKFIENKGITLLSKDLYVSDHRIAHALRDTKQRLSKAVSPEQLA